MAMWPLPTVNCRVVGLSRPTAEPFFASLAGAFRLSSSPRCELAAALATSAFARLSDAPHCRRRISRCLARCRAASTGLSKDLPSIDITAGVHSQLPRPLEIPRERSSALPGAFGVGLPSPPHVPPSWSLTTSTACSTDDSQACCIPLPILGFTGFPRSPSADGVKRFPSGAIPFRAYPPAKPHPRHRGPLPSCRFRAASPSLGGPCRLQGLAPCKRS